MHSDILVNKFFCTQLMNMVELSLHRTCLCRQAGSSALYSFMNRWVEDKHYIEKILFFKT